MKYIWGIYDIYLTPSAILFPRRSYIPPLPPRIPEGLTSLPPPIAQEFIRGP